MKANRGANLFVLAFEARNQYYITNKATKLSNLVYLNFKMKKAAISGF